MSDRTAATNRVAATSRVAATNRGAVTSTRWPVALAASPDITKTIHVVGDIHIGAMTQVRMDTLSSECQDLALPQPVRRIQIGDIVENSSTADAVGQAYLNSLSSTVPWDAVIGNHDLLTNIGVAWRTAAQWATSYGYGASQNYTRTLGFCKCIMLGTDTYAGATPGGTLSATSQTFLDTELGNTALDCLMFCHAPLDNTVLNDLSASSATSTDPLWNTHPSDAIRVILAAHSNARAWVSGHTHSPIGARQLVLREQLGGKTFLHLNVMSPWYTGVLPADVSDPIITVYLTVLAGRMEIRFRDHGNHAWLSYQGQTVTEVRLP